MKKFKVEIIAPNGGDIDGASRFWEIIEANNDDEAYETACQKFSECEVNEIIEIFDTPLNDKHIYVDMPDGFTYVIPVMVVAEHKAWRMKQHHDNDFSKAMTKEVLPEFENDKYEIKDWAKNNMNWQDVKEHAIVLKRKAEYDYQEHWVNGEFEIK